MNRTYPVVLILFLLVFSFSIAQAQPYPKRELRAAWIATVANIDWPSRKNLSIHQQQEEYVRILDTLKRIGMNAVVVQVRPMADTFYPSSYEPWSEYLSGTQGQYPQPYYNPLAFMIEQAHLRGLEFHAWFNPYRASANETDTLIDNHPLNKNPDWFLAYGGKRYYDPGNPQAQEYVLDAILETVKHYDLDAVHFDDYFYPYRIANVEFPDSCSYMDYGMFRFKSKGDWRRDNVNYFVKELSARIKQEKPHVKFGISPFGVWRNKDQDADGSDTQAGQTNYDDLYADVLTWLKEGWIDYITPQLYWYIGFDKADYTTLVKWWANHSYGKHLYIGQGIYRVAQKGWEDPNEIINQINLNRSYENVKGSMYFSAKIFLNDKENVNEKMRKVYPYPALIPKMDWINGETPPPPIINNINGSQGNGVEIIWSDSTISASSYYAVYRFDDKTDIDFENSKNIKAIVQRIPYATQVWKDVTVVKGKRYTYAITALDRLHNESKPGQSWRIKTRGRKGKIKID
jgi:uncharacterized lipoprotein YddW (UPF0748 family)